MGNQRKKPAAPAAPAAPPPPPSKEAVLGFYQLLRQLEPTEDRMDVIWRGPFWVDRTGAWRPMSVVLRRGTLRGQILFPGGPALMEANIRTGDVEWVDVDQPGWPRGTEIWPEAFPQLHERLRAAALNPEEYNRKVAEEMPPAWRTGKIQRRFTWREGAEQMSADLIEKVRQAARSAAARAPLPALSTGEYQRIAELGYDVAYPRERHLPRAEKHRIHADKRHGGMLDLPPGDADAFKEWFTSRRWEGAHPFEIAYGIPHGIVLWPELGEAGWRFKMWASDEIYHKEALLMLVALDEAGIPVEFPQTKRLLETFEGVDDVEVGPYRGQLRLEQLAKDRPDSISHVRWDPIEELATATADGRARIAWVEEHETMVGFEKERR